MKGALLQHAHLEDNFTRFCLNYPFTPTKTAQARRVIFSEAQTSSSMKAARHSKQSCSLRSALPLARAM